MLELGTQFSWVTTDSSLLFLQPSSRFCHHPLRPVSPCLEQSLRLHQQKSAGCSRGTLRPSPTEKKKKEKQAELFLALLCSNFRETGAQSVQCWQPLPYSHFTVFPEKQPGWQQLWFSCWESHLLKAASKSAVCSYCKLLLAGSNSPAVASVGWLELLF